MKRYWLFASAHNYPAGGLGDLVDTFDTWKECILCIEKEYGEGNEWCRDKDDYDFEIFDSEKHVIYDLDDDDSILFKSEYRHGKGFMTVKLSDDEEVLKS